MSIPDIEDRFLAALAEAANEQLVSRGIAWLDARQILEIGRGLGLPDNRIDHLATKMEEAGLLWDKGRGRHFEAKALAFLYEERLDREEFRRRNIVRREILEAAARANDAGERLTYHEGKEQFSERSWLELIVAARFLEAHGLVELSETMGRNFRLEISHGGYELIRSEADIRRVLPINATEDEEAHAPVDAAALREVITSCEQLLEQRGWAGALTELRRGDEQYEAGHWVDAVSEYYAAVESGLKHRLDEANIAYGAGAALRDLTRAVADAGLIPTNYQGMYQFLDSIRSPRRHGRGSRPDPVEVGPAEALLMSNHTRALLLYLGHRPR